MARQLPSELSRLGSVTGVLVDLEGLDSQPYPATSVEYCNWDELTNESETPLLTMSASSAPPSSSVPARSGMVSLYANLLDPSSSNAPDAASTTPASISRAPVVFKQTARDDAQLDDVSTKKQQINPGRFLLHLVNLTPLP